MKVFLILAPVFVFVGLWLIIYTRRRVRLMKAFGAARGLTYLSRDDGTLETALNGAFALPPPLGRNFSSIRDIVTDDGIRLFRVTESLDLNRYGMPQNTHSGRIAVYFETGNDGKLFFLADNAQEIRHILPKGPAQTGPGPGFEALEKIIAETPPPHILSVTMMGGWFLAYLEPGLTGSEKASDLGYLYELAQRVKRTL